MSLASIVVVVLQFAAFILAASLHELSHGYIAYKLGDKTAFNAGRLTLNPLAHIDLLGTIILPLFAAITKIPVIGWMKPVPVDPLQFRNPERGQAIVAFAGPFTNFLLALLSFGIIRGSLSFMPNLSQTVNALENAFFQNFLAILILFLMSFFIIFYFINLILMVFNLFPFPPLDGGWILRHLLPYKGKILYDKIYPFGMIILFILLFTGFFSKGLDYVLTFAEKTLGSEALYYSIFRN